MKMNRLRFFGKHKPAKFGLFAFGFASYPYGSKKILSSTSFWIECWLLCLGRASKCQNRGFIVAGCSTFSTALLPVLGSPVLLGFPQFPPPSPQHHGTAGCAHQGGETFLFHELLHVGAYKGHFCAVWEWKISFIKTSEWDPRGQG